MSFELVPHERAKDEESWEQRELRRDKTSWTGRYYRKAFHALNFASDAIQRLSRQPVQQADTAHPASQQTYGERPAV